MRQLIQDLATSATVILSTHIMQEVAAICDRALILRNGRLVLDEPLQDLQATQRLNLQTGPAVLVGELIDNGVASLGDGRWLIDVVGNVKAEADNIAKILVGASAPIYELSPAQRDLETIFREVNEEVANDAD